MPSPTSTARWTWWCATRRTSRWRRGRAWRRRPATTIRTYNYPENRISDHRTGYKAYNLDQVLDGALEPVIESCVQADMAARLAALGD
jgi:protein subunit release factor A